MIGGSERGAVELADEFLAQCKATPGLAAHAAIYQVALTRELLREQMRTNELLARISDHLHRGGLPGVVPQPPRPAKKVKGA